MQLTIDDKKMLDGDYGVGAQKCMKMLVQWGELFGAEKMVKVNNVHLETEFPAEAMREMSEGTEKARTFCTTHAVHEPGFWNEKGVIVEEIAGGAVPVDEKTFSENQGILKRLGFLPTFTCSPYLIGVLTRPGDVLCWTGSGGEIAANSFFGARAGRESAATCFAAAITGKTPQMGLLIKENRYAEVLVKIDSALDLSSFTDADYGALGYYIGGVVGSKNVALEGIPQDISMEHGRLLLSPLPVSGATVMGHIIGVTPEAPSLEEAFGGRKYETVVVGKKEMEDAYAKLNNAENRDVDLVALGCPHLTIRELGELASLLEGKRLSQNVHLVIGISKTVSALAKECGYFNPIESAGGIFTNTCISCYNPFMFVKENAKVAVTNSARGAHYMQRTSEGKTRLFYGDMKKCVDAAIKGKWEG